MFPKTPVGEGGVKGDSHRDQVEIVNTTFKQFKATQITRGIWKLMIVHINDKISVLESANCSVGKSGIYDAILICAGNILIVPRGQIGHMYRINNTFSISRMSRMLGNDGETVLAEIGVTREYVGCELPKIREACW